MGQQAETFPCIRSLNIQGYRPFGDFSTPLTPLEVIVGANGAGKSSLFEFLKFLRDAVNQDIPPEVVTGSVGRQIFHSSKKPKFSWQVEMELGRPYTLCYQGEVRGPLGRISITFERLVTPFSRDPLLDIRGGMGKARDPGRIGYPQEFNLRRPNQLALSVMTNPSFPILYDVREFVSGWRLYSAFNINQTQIRKSVPTEQYPILHEDGGNLSAVLFFLMTEHPLVFDELKTHLRSAIPGFRNLTVKARGGPGEVIAFWQEDGVDSELSLADLSDGILRFLCWAVLSLTPNPPTLVCIDEPDQGVHPRTLPILAGLFEKASGRTQFLLATHASYFLTQFDVARLAVMKKVDGESRYLKPADSAALRANLEEFGASELEAMHRSDELAALL
jgi:predicted ATPase